MIGCDDSRDIIVADLVREWDCSSDVMQLMWPLYDGRVEVLASLSLMLQVATDTRSLFALIATVRGTCEARRSMEVTGRYQGDDRPWSDLTAPGD